MWGRVARAPCCPGPLHLRLVFLSRGRSWVTTKEAPKEALAQFRVRGRQSPLSAASHHLDSSRESPSFSGCARGVRVHPRVCVHQVFRISLSSLRPRRWGRGSTFRDRAFPVLDGCWSGEVARSRSCAVAGQSPGPADLCVTCSGHGRTRSVALSAKALGWQVLLLWLSSRTPGPRAVSAKPQARLVRREEK